MKISIVVWAVAALFECFFVPLVLPAIEPQGSSGFAMHTISFVASIALLLMLVALVVYQVCWKKLRGKSAAIVLSLDLFFVVIGVCVALHLTSS